MIPKDLTNSIKKSDLFIEEYPSLEHISWKLTNVWNKNIDMYKKASVILFTSSNLN